ncbi:pre-rRNA processing protein [Savitreella phatthalungensis]
MNKLEGVRAHRQAKGSVLSRVAVVLAAVEDTIKASGSTPSPTAYFASLLALLDSSVSGQEILNQETAYAAAHLLDIIISDAPQPLLVSKFVQTLNLLVPLLNSSENATVRAAVGVLRELLASQTNESWRDAAVQQAMRSLLYLTLDHRPKVRRTAAEATAYVLTKAPQSITRDSLPAIMVADELLKTAATHIGNNERTGLLHTLQTIKTVASTISWPVAHVDRLCDLLLRGVAELGEGFVTVIAFEVFEKVFDQGATSIDSSRLEDLLKTIVSMKPNARDTNVLPPWLNVLSRGYELLSGVLPELTAVQGPQIFKAVFPYLQSDLAPIRQTASDCLQSLILSCLPTRTSTPAVQSISSTVLRALSGGTKYRVARAELAAILGILFGKLKSKADPLLLESLPILARARESLDDRPHIDQVLGAAIEAVGARSFLRVLPLGLTTGDGRAWLLPLLRDYVKHTELGFFKTELVPLCEQFYPRSLDGDVDAKIFATVINQIWSTLPGFCELPIDLREAFDQEFAELLGNVLYQQPELRPTVCLALQNLCLIPHQVLAEQLSDDELKINLQTSASKLQTHLKHMQKFAGNFLSLLFNVYSQTLPMSRGYILETIKGFLSVASLPDIESNFAQVLELLAQSVGEPDVPDNSKIIPPMKSTAMDLVLAFVPHLGKPGLQLVLELIRTHIPGDSGQMQKKAYKALNTMAVCPEGLELLAAKIDVIENLFLDTTATTSAAARKDRLHAMLRIFEHVPDRDLHFVPGVLSEVVMATKEQNEKTRTMAFDLLVFMGARMQSGGKVRNSQLGLADAGDVDASLAEYVMMLQGGLGSDNQHLVSASVTALSRVLFEFRDSMDREFVSDLLDTMEPILESRDREVARSALGFYKVVVISLPVDLVRPRLDKFVEHLLGWSHLHARDFRSKVKHLLERMVRRFGFDAIDAYMPEEDKKLLNNIRKSQERRKRKAKQEETPAGNLPATVQSGDAFERAMLESESEVSDDEDEENVPEAKSRSTRAAAYIQEDGDEPIDLLDSSALAHVSSTNPAERARLRAKQRMPSARANFRVDHDTGRFVFDDRQEPRNTRDQITSTQRSQPIAGQADFMAARRDNRRTAKGGVRFTNKNEQRFDDDGEDDEMMIDGDKPARVQQRGHATVALRNDRAGVARSDPLGPRGSQKHGIRKAPASNASKNLSAVQKLFQKKKGGGGEKAGGRKTRR